tara:strand:+ start:390 stop:824 length:435 start_codon:yes stop_codon:yes gene_type:complete
MRILTIILCISFIFSGELEVQGNLNVTGDINSPTIDALSGMKPERIYRYVALEAENKEFVVPNGKLWAISSVLPRYSGSINIQQNGQYIAPLASNTSSRSFVSSLIMLSGDIFNLDFTSGGIINIYEYPISASGTEQGMDYIVP